MAEPGGVLEEGAHVWVANPEAVWISARVSKSSSTEVAVVLDAEDDDDISLEEERRRVVPCGGNAPQILRRNVALLGTGALRFDDLTEVPELHEAAVLHALDERFVHGIIYTLTGPVLLAVNPFRTLPGLYAPDLLRSFVGAEKLQPHIFSVANHAYQGIVRNSLSQTVLVSGESGAGKTETTKFVMQFLALAGAEVFSDGKPLSRVERQVLRSNPLLEAFGNAKTLRNDNSSRFGKYIELQFGSDDGPNGFSMTPPSSPVSSPRNHPVPGASVAKKGSGGEHSPQRLVGTRIRTYLLEKVRVTNQQDGERNFHVFYQVLAAASAMPFAVAKDEAVTDGWELDLSAFAGYTACSFEYLQASAGLRLEQADDAQDFEATLAAMRTVGFSLAEVTNVLRVLAAVLHIGNVQFQVPARNSEASEVAGVKGPEASHDLAAGLLGVTQAELQGVFCMRTMQAPGEGVIRMANNIHQAAESRDALARHIYHALFGHVVERTNRSIGFKEDALFCGVLDIFGFEFFKTNSFEQLCINFTNELLQQYFNTFIFENETQLYRDEGISWASLEFPDNGEIVALLQQSPGGVFPMLDEECFVVGGTSSSWHAKLVRAHERHPNFSFVRHLQNTFVIQHFAGPVTYTAEGFLTKNKDRLTGDHIRCLAGSSWPFLSELFGEPAFAGGASPSNVQRERGGSTPSRYTSFGQNSPGSPASLGMRNFESPNGTRVTRAQRNTISNEFRNQLQDLMNQIGTTQPHFVRCIKPNPQSRPFIDASKPDPVPLLNRRSVVEQLRYQGVLEAIRVARAGYPVRLCHGDFIAEFHCILEDPQLRKRLSAIQDEAIAVSEFLSAPQVEKLLPPREASNGIQLWAIGRTRVFMKQQPFTVLRAAQARVKQTSAVRIQANWRLRSAKCKAAARFRGLITLQAHFRGSLARRRAVWSRRDRAATGIEAAMRTFLVCSRFHRARTAMLVIQRWSRMHPRRRRFVQMRLHAVRIQAWWRGWLRRIRMRRLPQLVLHIQRHWRGAAGRRLAWDHRLASIRLRRAVRQLVRTRARNLDHRRWRQKMLDMYRGPKSPKAPEREKEQSLKDYISLEDENRRRETEVLQLRSELQRLQWKVERTKSSGLAAAFARMCM